MPIYEFRCTGCEHVKELLQHISDPAPQTCEACGKEHTMEKIVSHTSFQLKGDGWYKDLYASKKVDPKKAGDSSSSDSSAKSDGGCGTATGACGAGKCQVN